MKKEFSFSYESIDSFENLAQDFQTAISAAKKAREAAYAPYSNFKVGAALLLENGDIITGNNQENKAYPSGLCAERVALFSYGALAEKSPIQIIAIVGDGEMIKADENFSPCGACRQAMTEYQHLQNQSFKIILENQDKSYHIFDNIQHLLPFIFGIKM